MNRFTQIVLFAALCVSIYFGFSARVFNAQTRPLHADEAEQTFTFARLYFDGEYNYNPNGPHGPILYYYALPLVDKNFSENFEAKALRLTLLPIFAITITLIFGAALFSRDKKAPLIMANQGALKFGLAASSVILLSLSSLSQIYSTYFVQEPFFALFSLMIALAAYAFLKNPRLVSALAIGVCAALLQCAKETSVIVFASVFFAALVLICSDCDARKFILAKFKTLKFSNIAKLFFVSAFAFFAIYLIFYSSFGQNWQGVLDGIKTYALHFAEKSTSPAHSKEIFYYIKLLAGFKSEGVLFGESAIFILSILGTLAAFARKNSLVIFLSAFAWINIFIMSLIGYKTPWLILAPLVVLCLPAGYAMSLIIFGKIKSVPAWINAIVKILSLAFLAYVLNLQIVESRNASLRYVSDPRNPFLYVHTVKDSERLIERIKSCARVRGEKFKALILTKASPWPLPWQTISLQDNVKFSSNPNDIKNLHAFDIIVYDETFDEALKNVFESEIWLEEFFGLRENLILRSQVKKDIFEKSIIKK